MKNEKVTFVLEITVLLLFIIIFAIYIFMTYFTNVTAEIKNSYKSSVASVLKESPRISDETSTESMILDIYENYNILIEYGDDTVDFQYKGLEMDKLYDDKVINQNVKKVKDCLATLPADLFNDFDLTIYLVEGNSKNKYSGMYVSKKYESFIILTNTVNFTRNFYHELFHYIEDLMIKKGYDYPLWDKYNPKGYIYGNKTIEYNYFIEEYSLVSREEDKATLFEDLMKNKCKVNYTKELLSKAKYLISEVNYAFDINLNCL